MLLYKLCLYEGFVTPLGCGIDNVWQRLTNSECGIVGVESNGELKNILSISSLFH